MAVYRGSGAEAVRYVENDHAAHAGAYYLKEGQGLAEIIEFSGATTGVTSRMQVDGEQYGRWVEGQDPVSGEAKGVLRNDDHANRFLEINVNGPKTWSLAAALHPDVADAYDAAMDQAVNACGRYLAKHATARAGKRHEVKQYAVDRMSMAAVRHYTSRAGDPHRHIHLQINCRVFAHEKWRGLDTQAVLRMQRALAGIGHRAILADPGFRQALAQHGMTLDAKGEIAQLAEYAPAFSKRAQQVARNLDQIRQDWEIEHPDESPSPRTLKDWQERAWNTKRPKKRVQIPNEIPESGWKRELQAIGADLEALQTAAPVPLVAGRPGQVDRAMLSDLTVKVLAAGANGKSAWNIHDVRGVVEELLAETQFVAHDEIVTELSEDAAARSVARCVSVLDGEPIVPGHIRHLTSTEVIEAERDLRGRLAARSILTPVPPSREVLEYTAKRMGRKLDQGQAEAARALAGTGELVVVEGPAGSGKTTVLSVARQMVVDQGHRFVVVAPSKKGADVAARETGAEAYTVAALLYSHGFRWDSHGLWSRLAKGDVDPVTGVQYQGPRKQHQMGPGDLVVVDEAGMLNHEQARALMHIVDNAGARIAQVGDRRQLPAVGRGGVLDEAARWAPAHVELSSVHRFAFWDSKEPDLDYADLTLRMRAGQSPGAVFSRLVETDRVRLCRNEATAVDDVARVTVDRHLAGVKQAVAVSTNEMAGAVNAAVREQLIEHGVVDDADTMYGCDGLRIGRGDLVMTRENDHRRGIANRETWTVAEVAPDHLRMTAGRKFVTIGRDYVQDNVHLGYASTIHGVQGETADHGVMLLDNTTDAAAVYVGMTRGRYSNTVFVVAHHLADAEEQWVSASDRNRADLGLDRAREQAEEALSHYSPWRDPAMIESDQLLQPVSLGDLQKYYPGATEADVAKANEGIAEWARKLGAELPADSGVQDSGERGQARLDDLGADHTGPVNRPFAHLKTYELDRLDAEEYATLLEAEAELASLRATEGKSPARIRRDASYAEDTAAEVERARAALRDLTAEGQLRLEHPEVCPVDDVKVLPAGEASPEDVATYQQMGLMDKDGRWIEERFQEPELGPQDSGEYQLEIEEQERQRVMDRSAPEL